MKAILILCAATVVALTQSVACGQEDQPAIGKKLKLEIESQLIPLMTNGNPAEIAVEISSFIQSHSAEAYSAAESYLKANRYPSLKSLFANSFVVAAQMGMLPEDAKLSLRETAIVVPELKRRIESTLTDLAKMPVTQDPILSSDTFEDYESRLWHIHVMKNRLSNASSMSASCQGLVRRFQDEKKKRIRKMIEELTDEQRSAITFDFESMTTRIRDLQKDFLQREIETRIYRLEDAASILSNSKDARDRLIAAFSLEDDAAMLQDFYRKYDPSVLTRENLKSPDALQSIQQTLAAGRKSGAEQMKKGSQLMIGMHWWLRGRYGSGPLADGMLKRKSAMKSEQAMFGLFMPLEMKEPSIPNLRSPQRNPQYERRHFYHWVVEYRPVVAAVSTVGNTELTNEDVATQQTQINLGRFY